MSTDYAPDIVQSALMRLVVRGVRDGDRLRALFIQTVRCETFNHIRDCRPVETTFVKQPFQKKRQDRTTSVYPTQVFAISLRDIVMYHREQRQEAA